MRKFNRKPNIACAVCKTRVYKRPADIQKTQGRVFCSQKCYGLSYRKEKPCIVCGVLILAGQNKMTCSRACANKHRTGIRYKLNRPKDKVVYHDGLKKRLMDARGKQCQRCGYTKHEILHVHHKDRNRKNNSLTNLELICPNCHAEEHYLGRGAREV